MAAHGIVDAFGHVSVRHNRDPNRFLMSVSRAPELISEADIVEYTLDAVPTDLAGRSQYSERHIHICMTVAPVSVVAPGHSARDRNPDGSGFFPRIG